LPADPTDGHGPRVRRLAEDVAPREGRVRIAECHHNQTRHLAGHHDVLEAVRVDVSDRDVAVVAASSYERELRGRGECCGHGDEERAHFSTRLCTQWSATLCVVHRAYNLCGKRSTRLRREASTAAALANLAAAHDAGTSTTRSGGVLDGQKLTEKRGPRCGVDDDWVRDGFDTRAGDVMERPGPSPRTHAGDFTGATRRRARGHTRCGPVEPRL